MNPGLKRALESTKVWTALGGVALSVGAALGLPPERVDMVVTAIVALASAVIIAIGIEDGSQKGNPKNADPPLEKQ